ncbi:MAG: sulfur oxidation c-type cytochrome SoxA [Gammaproteobacteria bacterium]|nr:sulfur oxidation c-type cytochrome SoxA [Gammaproteobacteria bacterium]MCY4227543.1 sulfur oxidation c-type cytochrome SoxA [Gammaproteobacteria bacterium]
MTYAALSVKISLSLLLLIAIFAGVPHGRAQSVAIGEEIEQFQAFFLERFFSVSLEEFNEGPYSLPQSVPQAATFRFLEQLPPYMHALIPARSEWNRTYNGTTLKNCMSRHPPANQFPYVLDNRVMSIEMAILDCLESQDRSFARSDSVELAALTAVFREQARGIANQVDLDDEKLKALYREGYRIFWSRQGQYNYSCASCHVQNAGNTLAGELISPALGHTTAFPVYSQTRASQTGNGWVTLREQYQQCISRMGAASPHLGDQRLLALEVFQTMNDVSIPLKAPQSRP